MSGGEFKELVEHGCGASIIYSINDLDIKKCSLYIFDSKDRINFTFAFLCNGWLEEDSNGNFWPILSDNNKPILIELSLPKWLVSEADIINYCLSDDNLLRKWECHAIYVDSEWIENVLKSNYDEQCSEYLSELSASYAYDIYCYEHDL